MSTNVRFLYLICIGKYITEICYEERAFNHYNLFLVYDILLKEILQISQHYNILKLFEGNLKNVCQKAIKANSSSFRNTSNVPMFRYHVTEMSEVQK